MSKAQNNVTVLDVKATPYAVCRDDDGEGRGELYVVFTSYAVATGLPIIEVYHSIRDADRYVQDAVYAKYQGGSAMISTAVEPRHE